MNIEYETQDLIQQSCNQDDVTSALQSDIIEIEANQIYRLVISLESCNTKTKITPTITIPFKKGWMKLNGKNYSYMLSTCNTVDNPVCEVEIFSELGRIDISLHCETTDYRNVSFWGSSKVLCNLRMRKDVISKTKVRYFCKDIQSSTFDSYIFTVELFIK